MGKKNKKSDDEEAEAEAPEPEPVAAEEEDDVPEGDTFGALLREFLASKTWTTVVMTATFFALFQVDICNMYFSKKADVPFAYLTLGWFVVFLFEMAMNFVMGIDYGENPGLSKFTFYFFLDLVGTLSLIPDFVIIFGITFPSSGSAMLARVARTARVGARLTRLMKVFRSSGGDSAYSQMFISEDDDAPAVDSAATKFGEEVSDGISKKVVFLTLVLLGIVPLFMPLDILGKADGIKIIESMNNENLVNTFANNAGPITYFQNFEDAQLVKLELSDDPSFRTPEGSLWGPNEAGQMGGPRDQKNCDYYKPYVNPITKTSCGGGSIISRLSGDGGCVQEPGVEPSPEMHNYYEYCNADDAAWRCLKSCGTITEPLIDWMDYSSMRESELLRFSPDYESLTDGEFIIETGDDDFPEFAITTDKGGDDGAGLPTRVTAIFYYRNLRVEEAWVTVTYMLFNMVVFGVSTGAFLNEILDLVVSPMERICSALTSLSKSMKSLQAEMGEEADEFEQLGASMLKLTDLLKTSLGEAGSAIIKNNLDDDSAGINAMVPGTKMNGYFAFCDCRKFDEVLQVLEEDVMVFTNTISKIIHEAVSSHLGQPNKNIGDSWLSVWSDKEEATFVSEDGMTFADHALMTFVEAFDSISSNDTLKTLGQRSGFSKNYPGGYTPDMGAGLHRGWAIEGAVGSEAKVDATYLSPHVNMSARLEAATKQYDCKILVSEDFYNRMSTKYQRNMRKVDRVMVVGASWPMILYAYDEGEDEGNAVLEKKNRFSAEMDQAVDKYISGEWKDAKKLLFSCLGSRNNDVAATKLIDFMASAGRGDNPPDGWEGYRQLTSK